MGKRHLPQAARPDCAVLWIYARPSYQMPRIVGGISDQLNYPVPAEGDMQDGRYRTLTQFLASDEFGRVAAGDEVGRGRGADNDNYVRLVHRLRNFLRFEPRR